MKMIKNAGNIKNKNKKNTGTEIARCVMFIEPIIHKIFAQGVIKMPNNPNFQQIKITCF